MFMFMGGPGAEPGLEGPVSARAATPGSPRLQATPPSCLWTPSTTMSPVCAGEDEEEETWSYGELSGAASKASPASHPRPPPESRARGRRAKAAALAPVGPAARAAPRRASLGRGRGRAKGGPRKRARLGPTAEERAEDELWLAEVCGTA